MNAVYLVTGGDLREVTNRTCWPVQAELEKMLSLRLAERVTRQTTSALLMRMTLPKRSRPLP